MAHDDLILGFRFGVFFLIGVLPNPLDIRFRKVSGLGRTMRTFELREGGQNLYTHRLPDGVDHENLVLERGMVVGSLLNTEVNVALSLYAMSPSNVLITVFDGESRPVAAWMCMKAYPVRWSTSDLDAGEASPVIDTFELAYTRLQPLRV